MRGGRGLGIGLLTALLTLSLGIGRFAAPAEGERATLGSGVRFQPGTDSPQGFRWGRPDGPLAPAMAGGRCRIRGRPLGSIDLSCRGTIDPAIEPAVAVDLAHPNHLLVGSFRWHSVANLGLIGVMGSSVSFDGGRTWSHATVPLPQGFDLGAIGDPAPVFDRRFGTVHMGEVAFPCTESSCSPAGIAVATSRDGGRTWARPVVVVRGSGSFESGRFVHNDKDWLTADNDPASPFFGRLYVTWNPQISPSKRGVAPIDLSWSDDAGGTWSPPVEVFRPSKSLCPADGPPYPCDADNFGMVATLPGGDVVVAANNFQNASSQESPREADGQVLVVRSVDGGRTWSPPVQAATIEGSLWGNRPTDYPFNVAGGATQTGFQFFTHTFEGITADPVTGDLWVFWTDNRDGDHDVRDPVTDTNVFLARSPDGGKHWHGPIRVTSGLGDKWNVVAAARDGVLRVLYDDASYDWPNRSRFGITLATSRDGGRTWSYELLRHTLSNPDDALWFTPFPGTASPGCERCAILIGDYNGLAIDALGRVHAAWTDLSVRRTCVVTSQRACEGIDSGSVTATLPQIFYARRSG